MVVLCQAPSRPTETPNSWCHLQGARRLLPLPRRAFETPWFAQSRFAYRQMQHLRPLCVQRLPLRRSHPPVHWDVLGADRIRRP